MEKQSVPELRKYFFTFGAGQKNAGFVQPIYATSYKTAQEEMEKQHGYKWASGYTAEEWEDCKSKSAIYHFPIEKEMPAIYLYDEG